MPKFLIQHEVVKLKPELVLCLGITDEVFMDGKMIGHVGFHECDGFIPFWTLDEKVSEAGNRLHTSIYTMKTGYGYHFVSLEIFSDKKFEKWKEVMQKFFPSDYKNAISHRVLRISKKKNAMQPTFMFSYAFGNPKTPISLGHLEVYKQVGIFNSILVIGSLVDTTVRFCEYKTARIRGE